MVEHTQHRDQSVRVLDLVTVDENAAAFWLDGHEFVDCELVGPIVMLIDEGTTFESNTVNTAQFWQIEAHRFYQGGVGVRNCRFYGCTFRDVGIAGPAEYLAKFTRSAA